MRRGVAGTRGSPYNRAEQTDDGVAVIEPAQVGDVWECCGDRYQLVEQQQGSLVRRWYTLADDSEQRPLAACRCCTAVLRPEAATQPRRAAAAARS